MATQKLQRYFTLQIFECFDIPIDDLWAEFDARDGVRIRTCMLSVFCRHSILRITHAAGHLMVIYSFC